VLLARGIHPAVLCCAVLEASPVAHQPIRSEKSDLERDVGHSGDTVRCPRIEPMFGVMEDVTGSRP
jgi:hypothetical protein